MVLTDNDLTAEIVMRVCDVQAPRFRGDPKAIYGEVFEKVIRNAARHADVLGNPTGFVYKTAQFESRRACSRERSERFSTLSELDNLADAGDVRRVSQLSVLDLLIYREEEAEYSERAEAARAVFSGLPLDQQEALLVVAKAQGCGSTATDLPKTVVSLAKLRGCSRQHIYNLCDQAIRAIRASISLRESKSAD